MLSIERYQRLMSKLKEHLFEPSENGLQNIVQTLAWYDSIYRTFNEGLRLAKSTARRKKIPKSLVEYIHRAHVSDVVITLRKLYDDKKQGTYAVNSLRTVTQKMLDNAHLFTRENYITFDGIPYEANGNLDWKTKTIVQGRHSMFDLLCGTPAENQRKRNDEVYPEILKRLHQGTAIRSEIETFANKFLAHSSAKNNRPDEKLAFANLRLARIQLQYKSLIWSLQQIARLVGEPVLTEVAVPQFDVLADWENGLFDNSIKRRLHKYWNGRMKWWRKWTDYYRDWNKVFLSPAHKGLKRK